MKISKKIINILREIRGDIEFVNKNMMLLKKIEDKKELLEIKTRTAEMKK